MNLLVRMPVGVAKVIAAVGVVISLYSVMNGVYHALVTWEFIDLFGQAARQNVQVGARRGLALLLIEFWPFAAIIVGGMGARIYWQVFRRIQEAHKAE